MVKQADMKLLGNAEIFSDLSDGVKLTPVDSDYFKDVYFAESPPCERLVNRKLNIRNINLMRDWKVALKEYLATYYKGLS